jgi:hypothetical protein
MFVKKFPTNAGDAQRHSGLIGSQTIAGLNAIGHGSQFAVRTRRFSKNLYRKIFGKKVATGDF